MKPFKLTRFAESDLSNIWNYTYKTWGKKQADFYMDTLEKACTNIVNNHSISKSYLNIHPLLQYTLCEHHYIFYLDSNVPIIIAVLHGRMDMINRLKRRL